MASLTGTDFHDLWFASAALVSRVTRIDLISPNTHPVEQFAVRAHDGYAWTGLDGRVHATNAAAGATMVSLITEWLLKGRPTLDQWTAQPRPNATKTNLIMVLSCGFVAFPGMPGMPGYGRGGGCVVVGW